MVHDNWTYLTFICDCCSADRDTDREFRQAQHEIKRAGWAIKERPDGVEYWCPECCKENV